MEVSQSSLAVMLLLAFLCGSAMGVMYDGLQMLRELFSTNSGPSPWLKSLQVRMMLPAALQWHTRKARRRHSMSAVAKKVMSMTTLVLQDLFFCVCAAIVMSLLLYATNDGQFRVSALFLATLGFVVYRIFPGRLVRRVWIDLLILLRVLLQWIVALLCFPVRLMWRYVKNPFVTLCCYLHKSCIKGWEATVGRCRRWLRAYYTKQKEKRSAPIILQLRSIPDGKYTFVKGNHPKK